MQAQATVTNLRRAGGPPPLIPCAGKVARCRFAYGGPPMFMRLATRLLVATLLLGAAATAGAHHSVAGEFDVHTTLTLTGVVSKVDWVNPHLYVHFDTKSKDGKVETWRLEGTPVGMARKAGLSKAMLEGHGETITILAYPARDGTKNLGYIVKINFPDGHFYQFTPDNSARKPG